jgi:hypothetical protein
MKQGQAKLRLAAHLLGLFDLENKGLYVPQRRQPCSAALNGFYGMHPVVNEQK